MTILLYSNLRITNLGIFCSRNENIEKDSAKCSDVIVMEIMHFINNIKNKTKM